VSSSADLRGELAAVEPTRECDRLAELSALFHGAGTLELHGRRAVSVRLDLGDPGVARRAFALLRSFGLETEIRTYRQRAFQRPNRFQLHVHGTARAVEVLRRAGVLDRARRPLATPPARVVARACCRRAYLRGALLAGGSYSGPRAPQVDVRTATHSAAAFVARVAKREGIDLAVRDRSGYSAATARGRGVVEELLAAAGGDRAVLALEEQAVMGETRSRANRLANADHANLSRTSRAAGAQLRAVRRLAATGALETLPARLREVAELRLENPSLSLRELGLKCRPPVGKAAAHRRLRRLEQLARE
jgi:DNA-binding protein WhiA